MLFGYGCTRESVGDDVFGAGDVMEGWFVFFKEKTPAKNTLGGVTAEFVSEVLVISVDTKNGTKKHRTEFFECVILLSRIELSCIERDGIVVLFNDCAKLEVQVIGFGMEWFVVIWVYE